MQQPKFDLAVIMRKRAIDNRWQPEVWEPVGVLMQSNAERSEAWSTGAPEPEHVLAEDDRDEWLFRGFHLGLRREDAEGYYLNISTMQPRVFVRWQLQDGIGVPERVTASYNDACTWMDAGQQVDSVAMPPELYDFVHEFVRQHYRPEPKKRIRPRSFQSRDQAPRTRQR